MKRNLILSLVCIITIASFGTPAQAYSKDDLSVALAKQANISEDQAQREIDHVFSAIKAQLKSGTKVNVTNFGSFTLASRKSKIKKTLNDGASMPALVLKKYAKFTANKELNGELNKTTSVTAASPK